MLRILAACSCLLLLLAGPANLAAQQQRRRGRVYVARGACPGEACGYGPWKPLTATALRARPDARSRRVGEARAGPCVNALTGVVRVYRPGRFVVQRPQYGFRPGDVLDVYTYVGEEVYKVRHRGRWIAEVSLTNSPRPGPAARRECETNPYCWGVFERKPDSDWWIKVRTPEGILGWTDEPANFNQPYWQTKEDCAELNAAPRRR